jgi:plasminogen activator inhibitor 1 RNA-binding protein
VELNRSSSDSDKKIHQGWGGDEGGTELKAEEAGTTDAQAEGVASAADGWDAVPIDPWSAPPPTDPWGIPPPEGDAAPIAEDEKGDDDRKPRERDPEEEDNTISYDQYLAQLKDTTTTVVPKLEGVREANEGANDVWGDAVEHKKNEDDQAYYVGKVCWVRD